MQHSHMRPLDGHWMCGQWCAGREATTDIPTSGDVSSASLVGRGRGRHPQLPGCQLFFFGGGGGVLLYTCNMLLVFSISIFGFQ